MLLHLDRIRPKTMEKSHKKKMRVIEAWFSKHNLDPNYFPLHKKTLESYLPRASSKELIMILIHTSIYHGLFRLVEGQMQGKLGSYRGSLSSKQYGDMIQLASIFGSPEESLLSVIKRHPTIFFPFACIVIQAKNAAVERQKKNWNFQGLKR